MLCALLLAGASSSCGSVTDTAARTPAARNCAEAVVEALERVGRNVYEESAGGRIAQQAAYRLQNTPALAQAVAAGNASAARQVLRGLLLNQIVSAQVTTRDGRVLARVTRGAAGIAPTSGQLRVDGAAVGGFAVAVQGANGYAQTVSGLTDTQVLVRSGRRVLHSTLTPAAALERALGSGASTRRTVTFRGVDYRVDTFAATAFPTGALSVTLLVPPALVVPICAGAAARASVAVAQADTWGHVAERVYYAEHAGSKAELLRSDVERSRAFREAVLAGNAKATRAAIVGFFRSHLHVVRVRVIREGKLLVDVGGPHVLGPIAGVVRNAHGRVAARFEMAIQDDLGFTLLARTFTGAQSVMQVGAHEVMGTLHPGPASIPKRGRVSYDGSDYEAYAFDAEAFPSGTLRISLLYPAM